MNKDTCPDYPYNVYTDMTPNEYGSMLRVVNENDIELLRWDLERLPISYDKCCLITFGSDGKLERHCQSHTELLILQKYEDQVLAPAELMSIYQKATGKQYAANFDVGFDGLPAMRLIGQDLMSYPFGKDHHAYPDVILNSVAVTGNPDLFISARTQVLQEMSTVAGVQGDIRHDMRNQLKEYKNTMASGESRKRSFFTSDPPIQFYDETKGPLYSTGFKQGPLRAIQRFLDLKTAEAVRANLLDPKTAAVNLPTSTHDRLIFLQKLGLFSPDLCTPADNAYSWFLQKYHEAQQNFKDTNKRVALTYNRDDFSKHLSAIQALIELPLH